MAESIANNLGDPADILIGIFLHFVALLSRQQYTISCKIMTSFIFITEKYSTLTVHCVQYSTVQYTESILLVNA